MQSRKEVKCEDMDAFNLNTSELEALKNDLLSFVHRASKDGTSKEMARLPAIAGLLLEHTGIIRLSDEQLRTVKNALCKAEYEMTTTNGLAATDRPDLPLTDDTSWTIDYSETLKAINEAISILDTSVYSRREIRV